MSLGRTSFTGYLISFLGILVASLVFLVGLAYWNDTSHGESTCITSSGEEC